MFFLQCEFNYLLAKYIENLLTVIHEIFEKCSEWPKDQ